jgi:tetratricopeptide (TPR) repeat protein
MRILIFLSFSFFLIITNSLMAQNSLFKEANTVYQSEDYLLAITLYDSILKSDKESMALHYNLGNAYFKEGNIGKSILHYEKALRLKPQDEEILHNLGIARQKTVDRFEEVSENLFQASRLAIIRLLSPDHWARLALFSLLLASLGLASYLFSSYLRIGFITILAGLSISLLSIIMAWSHENYLKNNQEVILLEDSSYVKSGPSENADDVFILHEGTKALRLEQFENWSKIKLPDGKLGWLLSAEIAVI